MTPDWPLTGTPLAHQAKALAEAGCKPGHAYWIDAGGGKTAVCYAEATKLWLNGEIDGMLILAPPGPHEQWITEQLPLWCTAHHTYGAHNKLSPGKVEKFFALKGIFLPVFAINYESLIMPSGQKLVDRFFKRWPRVYLVIDESSKIKSVRSARAGAAIGVARRARFSRVLSGTPILKGIEDLFTQYDAITPGVTGFHTWTAYRNYYCQTVPITAHTSMIVGYRNQNELHERIAPVTTHIPSREFLKTETPIFTRVVCPMNADQERTYKQMKKDLLAQWKDTTVTVQNALVQTGKLMQIASGFVTDAEHHSGWINDNKSGPIMDLLDDLDEPVILYACHIPLMDLLEQKLRARKDRPIYRYKERRDVEQWQITGGVIIGNQASGLGIGQNLQNAAATIYAASNFNTEARLQSIKRTNRTGQTRQCRYWDMVSPGTIDIGILQVLADNEQTGTFTLEMLRRLVEQSDAPLPDHMANWLERMEGN